MSAWRLAAYAAGLAICMLGLVAIQQYADGGLRLLTPSPFAETLGTSEYSVVEWLQVCVLVAIGGLAAWSATMDRRQSALGWMLAALAAVALCRELDLFFDGYLFDHAWQLCAAVIAVAAIVHGLRHRAALRRAAARALAEPGLVLVVCGVLLLVAFANVIGSDALWRPLLGDAYLRTVKVAVEELTELGGYWLWLIGQIEYTLSCARRQRLGASPSPGRRRGGRER